MDFSHLSLQLGDGLFGSQVFDFVGGLFLLLIGAAILYTLVVWRLRALQVAGDLVGLRRRGPYWHGVYRYALPDGRSMEATSVQGRARPQGAGTDRRMPIQVMPDKPDEARERRAPLSWTLGLGSFVSGAWLLHLGATITGRGAFVWLVIALAAACAVRWLWHRVKSLLAQMQPMAAPVPWSALPIEPVDGLGTIASSPSRPSFSGSTSRASAIFVVLGLVLLALGAWQVHGLLALRQGVRTSGEVVALSEGSAGRSGETYFFPVVRYVGPDGNGTRFLDRVGARPSPFKVGDTVPVRYVQGAPATATIDRALANWEPVVGLFVMGSMLTGLGLMARRRT